MLNSFDYDSSTNPRNPVRTDSRLFRMLHVLLHMARDQRSFTSEELAKMLNTNPTVVRRTMASLRDQGYVSSEKGHGGGWTLRCNLKKVTLLDIYDAVGKPTIFSIGVLENDSKCMIETVVNHSIQDALEQAEQVVLQRFGDITLYDLDKKLNTQMKTKNTKVPH